MTRKLETIKVLAQITATSNKQNKDFATDNPRKSLYLKVNEENKKILEDNGFTEYTSKEDETPFFIVKAAEKLKIFDLVNNELKETLAGHAFEIAGYDGDNKPVYDENEETPNFSTDEEVYIAILKSESKGREYARAYAILGDVTMNEAESPFKDLFE